MTFIFFRGANVEWIIGGWAQRVFKWGMNQMYHIAIYKGWGGGFNSDPKLDLFSDSG